MPFFDYTKRNKNMKNAVDKQFAANSDAESKKSKKTVSPTKPDTQNEQQPPFDMMLQQNGSQPAIQYRIVASPQPLQQIHTLQQQQQQQAPPLQYVISQHPPPTKTIILPAKPSTSTMSTNTEEPRMIATATMTDRDLVRMYTRATNTDLRLNQVQEKKAKEKINHFNEGFRTYYDDEADVLGVNCCMCCNNCWNKCNNICKGCRNSISFPVYFWVCCIIPVFIILSVAILMTFLHGVRII